MLCTIWSNLTETLEQLFAEGEVQQESHTWFLTLFIGGVDKSKGIKEVKNNPNYA